MCNRSTAMIVVFALALGISSIVVARAGQDSKTKNDITAHAQGFDPHDLSGVWAAPVRVTTGKEVAPMTPWGLERFKANKPFNAISGGRIVPLAESNDPMIVCDPLGFPRNIFYEIRHMKFVQTPSEVIQLMQYQGIWREIWTDGRKLPTNVNKPGGPDSRWYGYSVGKWDDNTFVVETTGVNDQSWLDVYGDPHSSDMRVEERYTRLDHDHLKLTVTIDDPKTYTKPFLAQPGLVFELAHMDLPEQMCVPSEALTYLKAVAEPADGGKNNPMGSR